MRLLEHGLAMVQRGRRHFDRLGSVGALAAALGVLTAALVLLFTLFGWWVKPQLVDDDGTRGFSGALWWTLTRLLSADALSADRGTAFRIVGLLVTLTGLATLMALFALGNVALSDALAALRARGRPVQGEIRTLVLGASQELLPVLRALRAQLAERARLVLLADAPAAELDARAREHLGDLGPMRLLVRHGAPAEAHAIAAAGGGRAGQILVLGGGALAPPSGDLLTLAALVALRTVPGARPRARVVAPLIDEGRRVALEQVGGDGLELVNLGARLARLTVRAARFGGLGQVYGQLLGANGLGLRFVNEGRLVGSSFGKAQWGIEGAVALGVRQQSSGRVVLNPPDDTLLEPEDELLVLADDALPLKATPAVEPQLPSGYASPAPTVRKPDRILLCGPSPRLAAALRVMDQEAVPTTEAWLMRGWSKEAYAEFLRNEVGTIKNLRLTHVEGDPTRLEDLSHVVGPGFGAVVVLADTSRPAEEADMRTVLTVLHVREACNTLKEAAPRIVAEVLDPATEALLVQDGATDVLPCSAMAAVQLAHLTERPALASVYADLFTRDRNELYLKRSACYAADGQSAPWPVIQRTARLRGEIAVGYQKAGARCVLNPPKSAMLTFFDGDHVVVLATDDVEGRELHRPASVSSAGQSRERSRLLPPAAMEGEPTVASVSAGPRVRGPSNTPRQPLPGKLKA